jgi:hypothetical protein
MITALLTYIVNAYPQGVNLSRTLDSLVRCLIEGRPPPSPWLCEAILTTITKYTQDAEKESYTFRENWQLLEVLDGFVQIL